MEPITVRTTLEAPVEKVWQFWNGPEHIVNWAFAQDDWEAPSAENDLKEGGRFTTVMAAKDGTSSFDFTGTYSIVEENKLIEYDMDPEPEQALSGAGSRRHVRVEFSELPDGQVEIVETFDPEQENTVEVQRSGWQAILDNFKKYVESH